MVRIEDEDDIIVDDPLVNNIRNKIYLIADKSQVSNNLKKDNSYPENSGLESEGCTIQLNPKLSQVEQKYKQRNGDQSENKIVKIDKTPVREKQKISNIKGSIFPSKEYRNEEMKSYNNQNLKIKDYPEIFDPKDQESLMVVEKLDSLQLKDSSQIKEDSYSNIAVNKSVFSGYNPSSKDFSIEADYPEKTVTEFDKTITSKADSSDKKGEKAPNIAFHSRVKKNLVLKEINVKADTSNEPTPTIDINKGRTKSKDFLTDPRRFEEFRSDEITEQPIKQHIGNDSGTLPSKLEKESNKLTINVKSIEAGHKDSEGEAIITSVQKIQNSNSHTHTNQAASSENFGEVPINGYTFKDSSHDNIVIEIGGNTSVSKSVDPKISPAKGLKIITVDENSKTKITANSNSSSDENVFGSSSDASKKDSPVSGNNNSDTDDIVFNNNDEKSDIITSFILENLIVEAVSDDF